MKRYCLLSICIFGIWLLTMGSALAKDNKFEELQTQIDNHQSSFDPTDILKGFDYISNLQ